MWVWIVAAVGIVVIAATWVRNYKRIKREVPQSPVPVEQPTVTPSVLSKSEAFTQASKTLQEIQETLKAPEVKEELPPVGKRVTNGSGKAQTKKKKARKRKPSKKTTPPSQPN